MSPKYTAHKLANQNDWDNVAQLIAPRATSASALKKDYPTLNGIFELLGSLKANSVIIEHDYLDQDFTAEFSQLYSKLFKKHHKVCQRLHFFVDDVVSTLQLNNAQLLSETLEASQNSYLGFIVIRPVPHAPVGRTILVAPPSPLHMNSKLLVRSKYDVHLLGANLEVIGTPLIQQDSRAGACAQASIWIAGRHFHSRHRGPWFSVSRITEEALKPTDAILTTALPAGSTFLRPDNMVRALRAMGRETLTYISTARQDPTTSKILYEWPANLRPYDVINRYIDSGIPVILGLGSWTGSPVGHAVVAVGHTTKVLAAGNPLPNKPTRAEYSESFLVNDDQLGSYLRMPILETSTLRQTPYSIDKHLLYLLIPLPEKVFLPAEIAEQVAWDFVQNAYAPTFAKIKSIRQINWGSTDDLSNELISALSNNTLIARTYLTYGWKYKRRMLRNICSPVVKQAILASDFPKYVWVTEFGSLDSLNHLRAEDRRILSHVVSDATSSQFSDNALVFHAPGLLRRWYQDSTPPIQDTKFSTIPITDDVAYLPKTRGKN